MRIASTALLTALTLVLLAHGGVLACGSSDSGTSGAAGASAGGALPSAGSSGAPVVVAGAGGTVAGVAGGGADNAGSAGASAGSPGAAGTGGSAAGAGGVGGSAGSGGAGGGSAGSGGNSGMGGSGGAVPFALTSPLFVGNADCAANKLSACAKFPSSIVLQTIGGMNHSPELDWTAGPAGTLSYAISLFDESNMYPHWVVWNIPASASMLPGSLPGGDDAGGLTGLKQVSFNGDGTAYAGPGANSHEYLFKIYALKVASIAIALPGGANQQEGARMALETSKDVIATAMLRGASAP